MDQPSTPSAQVDPLSDVGRCAARARDRLESVRSDLAAMASETRLVALNAGCEAARLGTDGESFRVVAQAVEQLAQRIAEAQSQLAASADDEDHVCRRLTELRRQSHPAARLSA